MDTMNGFKHTKICEKAVLVYFTIFNIMMLLQVTAVTGIIHMTKLKRNTALDDHTCLTLDLLFSTSIRDVSRCAIICVEKETCQTMFYNQNEGKCRGCTAQYTHTSLPLPSPGFIHFQKESTCGNGVVYFGSCYFLSPPANDFGDGVEICEGEGAHPVYIETSEENDFLKTFFATHLPSMWYIGLTNGETQGIWKYYNTNTTAQFLDFHSSQQDNDGTNTQLCVLLTSLAAGLNNQWVDHHCRDDYPTICEKAL